MELTCPITGFDEFFVYRGIGEDEIEVILGPGVDLETYCQLMGAKTEQGRAQAAEMQIEMEGYVLPDQAAFRLWLLRAQVPRQFHERFVDLVWNWRLLKYDLRSHHLSIPEVQRHPLEHALGPGNMPFRVPRPNQSNEDVSPQGGRDFFDPLQDKRNRDFWSPT